MLSSAFYFVCYLARVQVLAQPHRILGTLPSFDDMDPLPCTDERAQAIPPGHPGCPVHVRTPYWCTGYVFRACSNRSKLHSCKVDTEVCLQPASHQTVGFQDTPSHTILRVLSHARVMPKTIVTLAASTHR
ncbi:hypothetical protein V8C42DRAFT_318197, partial [Trichoderma barbatum]